MLFRKEEKYYVTLSDRELRLAKYALLQFRNKLLAEGKPVEDVNSILLTHKSEMASAVFKVADAFLYAKQKES